MEDNMNEIVPGLIDGYDANEPTRWINELGSVKWQPRAYNGKTLHRIDTGYNTWSTGWWTPGTAGTAYPVLYRLKRKAIVEQRQHNRELLATFRRADDD